MTVVSPSVRWPTRRPLDRRERRMVAQGGLGGCRLALMVADGANVAYPHRLREGHGQ